MKAHSIILPLLAASAQAFILSPTCVKAYHKTVNKFDQWAQEAAVHICNQGCVLTAETYHNTIRTGHIRPTLQKGLERHFARLQISEDEIDRALQFADTLVESLLEQCPPRGTAQPDQYDICRDPQAFDDCASKAKTRLPGACWKHKSLILAHSDNETCRDVAAVLDDPLFWRLIEEEMDAYAASCPVRK